MVNPQFIEQSTISLVEVKQALTNMEQRDKELNYRATKVKEFLDAFPSVLSAQQQQELAQKLRDLNLTRLKEEHITKICDFLPTTQNDLKAVLAAYPLSMPKKDMEQIIDVVKGFA